VTAIACYFQREHDNIFPWAVADSRVSKPGAEGSEQVLHDHAVKIFSIPFTVIAPAGKDKIDVIYTGSFGYCYSGSSLTGLNTHAAFSHLLRMLETTNGHPPTLREITDFVVRILKQYISSYAFLVQEKAVCECAILGLCPSTKTPRIYILRPDTSSGTFEIRVEELDSSVRDGYALLGDKKADVRKFIDAARARVSEYSINWWRAPWHGLQEVIDSKKFPTIGGYVQIGLGEGQRFRIVARSESPIPGEQYGKPEFLGLDLETELAAVGSCTLRLPRMAGLKAFTQK
jgi:hypothetical protein